MTLGKPSPAPLPDGVSISPPPGDSVAGDAVADRFDMAAQLNDPRPVIPDLLSPENQSLIGSPSDRL